MFVYFDRKFYMGENMEKYNSNNIIKDILKWWENNKRIFPWRETNDPYIIICSEIMLQQTNAEKVEQVYYDFFEKYPTIFKLNESSLEEIFEFIKPLGLYKRAESLKEIAEIVVKKYDGKIPHKKCEIMKLPGVGHYTAGAVMVFAYDKSYGLIDTNTIRVLERVFLISSDKSRPRTDKKLRKKINNLIKDFDAKKVNYAFLDFASLICQKKSPKCKNCPVKNECEYNKK